MKFCFNVDSKKVEYNFDPFLESVKIGVDGQQVAIAFQNIWGKKKSAFLVDEKEVSVIVDQPILLSLFKKKTYKVYIDSKLFKVFDRRGRNIKTMHAL